MAKEKAITATVRVTEPWLYKWKIQIPLFLPSH